MLDFMHEVSCGNPLIPDYIINKGRLIKYLQVFLSTLYNLMYFLMELLMIHVKIIIYTITTACQCVTEL